ncbi:MAG: hypothetical protein KY448_13235, partial [Cyanobacteria bacterium 0813]|nr:hypothetical protein [Cyanobacteria bacterium 0813]
MDADVRSNILHYCQEQAFRAVPQRMNFLLVEQAFCPPGQEQAFRPVPQRMNFLFVEQASCPPGTGGKQCN